MSKIQNKFYADTSVTTGKLAATSVTAAKLGSDVAGTGLGGGNGSALALNISGLTAETAPASDDTVGVYDSSAAAHRKMSLANLLSKAYLKMPTTNGDWSGWAETVTVDVNSVGIGAILYEASDGHFEEADADASTTMPGTAIALEAGTGSKLVLRVGYLYLTTWPGVSTWTKSGGMADMIFVSTTQGQMVAASGKPTGTGDQIQCVGQIHSANVIFFCGAQNLNVIELV
jgi:hypothetical protein